MTKIVNSLHQSYEIFIGRGSHYGNPFSHIRNSKAAVIVSSREEAVRLYRQWLLDDGMEIANWAKPTRKQILALHGHTLGCFCDVSTQACHGTVLAELAEAYHREETEQQAASTHPTTVDRLSAEDASKVLAHLRYDVLASLLLQLGEQLEDDADADRDRGRPQLSAALRSASNYVEQAAHAIEEAWKHCKGKTP